MQALLPALVPPALLSRAIAANASAGQTAIIAGPALGGLIYVAGPAAVYGTSTALFVLTGLMIFLIRADRALARASPPGLSSVLEGIRFIRRQPAVLGAISLDMFAVLLGGATALLPTGSRVAPSSSRFPRPASRRRNVRGHLNKSQVERVGTP